MVRRFSGDNLRFAEDDLIFSETDCQNSIQTRGLQNVDSLFLRQTVRFLLWKGMFLEMKKDFPKKIVTFRQKTEDFGRGREDFPKKIVKIDFTLLTLRPTLSIFRFTLEYFLVKI